MVFSQDTNLTFSGNEVRDSQSPAQSVLQLEFNPWLNISYNTFRSLEVERGVCVKYSDFGDEAKAVIEGNEFAEIEGRGPGVGIALLDSTNLLVQNNTFSNLRF